MSYAGQWNFQGVNSQAQISLLLFLKSAEKSDFRAIRLEDAEWEDFTLYFEKGKKICEVKSWAKTMSFSSIREIIRKIAQSKGVFNLEDEILICTRKVGKSFFSKFEGLKLGLPQAEKFFVDKGFTAQEIDLLKNTTFEIFEPSDLTMDLHKSFSHFLQFYVQKDMLSRWINDILIRSIYTKSAKGDQFSQIDFRNEIEAFRKERIEDNGTYNGSDRKTEAIIASIISAIENKQDNYLLKRDNLLALSAQPNLMFFASKRIASISPLNLKDWDFFLPALIKDSYIFGLFSILENNISGNEDFILDFIEEHYEDFIRDVVHGISEINALRIVKNILDRDLSRADRVFTLTKKVLESRGGSIKSTKHEFKQEKEIIAELMLALFEYDIKRKELVVFCAQYFDLTEGGFGIFSDTPRAIYTLLLQYVRVDFLVNFREVVNLIIDQYQENYHGKFKGREWIGGGVSRSGSRASLSDRHFVDLILTPAIIENNDFEYVRTNCLAQEKNISAQHPDFLNRAALPIMLERFKSEDRDVKAEAFNVLVAFVNSKKGIPHKSALIYQAIRSPKFTDDQRWELSKIHAQKYDRPTSIFLDQIVIDLAAKGHLGAKKVIDKWQKNPDYYDRFTASSSISVVIRERLDHDFSGAVDLFKNFIQTTGFIKDKFDRFEVYELARVLSQIMEKDVNIGLDVLNGLFKKSKLGDNEQILFTNALSNIGKDKRDVIITVYEKFVDPFLTFYQNDSLNIAKTIVPHNNSREQFVVFAEKLAELDEVGRALRIIKAFINDPDPYLPDEDPEGAEHNEHARIERGEVGSSITSVRGWCGWVLMKCASMRGRNFIDEIIDLTEVLVKDRNYYVQHASCFSLSQLAHVRLAKIEGGEELFFGSNLTEALKRAKKIEDIAFDLLKVIAGYTEDARGALAKSLLSVFGGIRALSQVKAGEFISIFSTFPSSAIAEAAYIFIFFAEFREEVFRGWILKEPGFFDDLEQFDSKPFQRILSEFLQSEDVEIRRQFGFKLATLPDEVPEEERVFRVSLKYLKEIIVAGYDDQLWGSIYIYFIADHLEKYFDDCYALWRHCMTKEVQVLRDNYVKGIPKSVPNWIEHVHDKILLKVKEVRGEDQFLQDLNMFMDLPLGINFYGIQEAIAQLRIFSPDNKKVEAIYDKLIERDSSYYDEKKAWKDQV